MSKIDKSQVESLKGLVVDVDLNQEVQHTRP
jgi:hypothetical protein